MTIGDRVERMSERVRQQRDHVATEQGTRQALINPFIRDILGFDVNDLREERPEYTADVGSRKRQKVDYALMVDGQPVILIEAKMVGTALHTNEPRQLKLYFEAVKSAKFGVYTDGIQYLFYSDLGDQNLMDLTPCMELDLQNVDPEVLEEIEGFHKANFDAQRIRERALLLRGVSAIRSEIQREMREPSDEFVRMLMGRVTNEQKSAGRLARYKGFIQTAFDQITHAGAGSPAVPPPMAHDNQAPLAAPEQSTVTQRPRRRVSESPAQPAPEGWVPISTFNPPPGTPRPTEIRFPDSAAQSLKNWKDLLIAAAEHLSATGRLSTDNLPPADRGAPILLGSPPVANDFQEQAYRYTAIAGGAYYVQTHGSARAVLNFTRRLLEHYGFDLEQVQVHWQSS